jgi:hypothetical protein
MKKKFAASLAVVNEVLYNTYKYVKYTAKRTII